MLNVVLMHSVFCRGVGVCLTLLNFVVQVTRNQSLSYHQ